jgi:ferredoxin-NADP reductase
MVADIIYEKELKTILGAGLMLLVTREFKPGYIQEHIDKKFLQRHVDDFKKPFYICGPDAMVADISGILQELGASADTLVFEK